MVSRSLWRVRWLAVLLVSLFTIGCGSQETEPQSERLQVSVSILPQQYFAERIGGDLVSTNVMVGPGETPHSYEPSAEQLVALSRSALYFRIGVEFEDAWMDRITDANTEITIVDTTAGIDYLPIASDAGEHAEGDGDEHEEHLDPHIWLSPKRVKSVARSMADALAAADPSHRETYEANLAVFLSDIDALDQEIAASLDDLDNRRFLVFHPAWGYFAADYGLEEIPIEAGGQEPSAAELADIIALARQDGIRVIFAQPTMSTRTAETIADEIDGRVLLIDPLAEDWLGNMRQVAGVFAEVLGS